MPKRFWIGAGVATLLAALLSGCIASGAIDKRATAIDLGVGDSLNRALLINLARASRNEPLYFLSMGTAHGSATEDFRLGLPSLVLGPKQTSAQKQYVFGTNGTTLLDSQTATSFDVGVLSSKDFYAGLLTPLGLGDVNLLFSQGYSRELVLYLVVDSLKVTDVTDLAPGASDADAPTTVFYNDPRRPNYSEGAGGHRGASFEGFIREAMEHGLTTEAYMPVPKVETATTTEAPGSAPGVKVYIAAEPAPKPKPATASVRLCYDFALASRDAKTDFEPESPRCGASPSRIVEPAQGAGKLPVHIGPRKLEIEVRTRSIFGVFNYLGGLIANQQLDRVRLHAYADLPAEMTADEPLLALTDSRTGCFTAVNYGGRNYCVPSQGAGAENTKRIFNIINALLALKTSPGDLPVTQTVRLTP